jgi:ribosomal protein S18 acetylase RimI-like enzyme
MIVGDWLGEPEEQYIELTPSIILYHRSAIFRKETQMSNYAIRPLAKTDREWVRQFSVEHWGDETVVAHGQVFRPHELPGFAAFDGEQCIGLLTYRIEGQSCEAVTINSLRAGLGIGSALIGGVVAAARAAGCTRLYLITSNDNLNALRFYQKRGFVLVAVHRNALERSRVLKPAIPLIGFDGIPLRDEIELEMLL